MEGVAKTNRQGRDSFKETIKEHKLQWKSVMEVERDQNETQGQKGALARIKHGITVTRNG